MTAMLRAGRLIAALVLTMAALSPSAWAAPVAVDEPYSVAAVWSSCSQFFSGDSPIPTAQCGTVAVPVDYAKPEGAQAQLAVIKVPASGSKIGMLVVNPGGPGASAVDTVASMGAALADTDILRHFDLVGIDPRGVGHSTPSLRCRTDAEFDAYRAEPMVDYSPAGVAHIEGVLRQFAQQCLDRMGAEFLAGVGTATAARDMDVVRAALGEERINYLGFSYGTQLGAVYAARYPDRIRAMVLDGAVDPSLDPITESLNQMAGFQRAFDNYADSCAEQAGCPLGADPARFNDRFRQLVNPLAVRPAATSDPRGLGYQDAITGTVSSLYSPRYWTYLTSGLLGLERGTDPGDLLKLADDYQQRDVLGHYKNRQDAFTAIRCVDSIYPTDPAVWADADRRARQVAPFVSYGEFTGYAPRDVCALWPVPPTPVIGAATSPGPGKVVVVSTTGDPATPYEAGVNLARQMGASLISFTGAQHTVVFNGDACVDTAVVDFLVESTPPPVDLRC
ncbi:alpha/beta hydrolase fold protein [Mycolicibacterium aurum]|uniref:Alpha/beta hydrolase fold protein n=1 Tax=Mycolicibacterium aurum TaxID=1791 RepID=A0A3S4S4S2_MYCAU|nr:alpha/beta hydrolase [Mycolicibacterium aurum]VEG56362.1 alpha/beta hydrolase fold protein [Mycolicibacterium aurum]